MKRIEVFYVALGALALFATWAQVPAYLSGGFWNAQLAFWKDAVPTPASIFIVVDILVVAAVVTMWMFSESRRLGLAPWWPWLYFAGSLFIAISLFVPLFFAHRERRLRALGKDGAVALSGTDWIAVAMVLGSVGAGCFYSFTHLPAP